jgi:Helix-turn-helix domain
MGRPVNDYRIIRWAMRQTAKQPARHVLLVLAAHANEKGQAWPSLTQIAECTGISRSGVIRRLKGLAFAKLIEDTGERRGETGRVIIWQLAVRQEALALKVKRTRAKPLRKRGNGASVGTIAAVPNGSNMRNDLNPGNGPTGEMISFEGGNGVTVDTRNTLEGSDTNVSAANAADPIKELFDFGVKLLTESGTEETKARSLIGRWRKGRTDGEIITGLIECRAKAISNPAEWLAKRFKSARYVSQSGYEYRGTREQVKREAEKRHDMNTYWSIAGEEKKEAEARRANRPAPG